MFVRSDHLAHPIGVPPIPRPMLLSVLVGSRTLLLPIGIVTFKGSNQYTLVIGPFALELSVFVEYLKRSMLDFSPFAS